jgi:beta-lactamase regulating signal transducer with metallopeptidase domain
MNQLFITVLNMSITASYVIILIILVRLFLKKAPKYISYALWVVVAFRLVIPFSYESIISLLPQNTNTVPIPYDIIFQQNPQINSGIKIVDSYVSKSLPRATTGASVNPLQIYMGTGTYIWIFGMIALFTYSVTSIFLLKNRLKDSKSLGGNIFEAYNLKTPFVLGLIKPKIYLPTGINNNEKSYILLHEQIHIKRKDHIIKVLAFVILCVHWFNPLVWISFILMGRDMELSCDEKVLKHINNKNIKKIYADSLLSLATDRHILNGNPLAFGEGKIKGRIKNVLNYRPPRFWVIIITVVLALVIGTGLVVNPINTGILSDVVDFTLNLPENIMYGSLVSGNKHLNFNKEEGKEIVKYLSELKISKSAIYQSRDHVMDATNQVHFVYSIDYNDDFQNVFFNFNEEFTRVWVSNDIKPSISYNVKIPDDVKRFLGRYFDKISIPIKNGSDKDGYETKQVNEINQEEISKYRKEGIYIPGDATKYLEKRELDNPSLLVNDRLQSIYDKYAETFDDGLLIKLQPIDIFRLHNKAIEEENHEVGVNLINLLPEIDKEELIKEAEDDYVSNQNQKIQLEKYSQFNGKVLELLVSENMAYIIIQGDGFWRFEKTENDIWKLGWLARQ